MPFDELSLIDCAAHIVDNRGRSCPVGDAGLPLIATNCLREGGLYPTYETSRFVSDETYKTWFRGHPKPGDLIFVTKGSPGRVCLAPNPVDFCIAQDMVAIRADETKVYPKYLFAVLRSDEVQRRISNMHVGTLIPHFKKGDFDKLLLPIPTRQEQVFIGDVYFEISSRMDLLRRTNATLESIAQALFKSWFIDFDPVRAKAEGREPEGMDAATAALFPAEFEESVLGVIPKGWSIKQLREVAKLVKGRSYKSSELADSETALVTLKSFERGGGFREDGFKSYRGPFKPEQVVVPGECVVALTDVTQQAEVIGRAALVTASPNHSKLVASLDVGALRPIAEGLTGSFLYFLCRGERYVQHVLGYTTGTTVLHLAKEGVESFPLPMPPSEVARSYSALTDPLLQRMTQNKVAAKVLVDLRDALLPRLISGKLRLPEAQEQLEGATV